MSDPTLGTLNSGPWRPVYLAIPGEQRWQVDTRMTHAEMRASCDCQPIELFAVATDGCTYAGTAIFHHAYEDGQDDEFPLRARLIGASRLDFGSTG